MRLVVVEDLRVNKASNTRVQMVLFQRFNARRGAAILHRTCRQLSSYRVIAFFRRGAFRVSNGEDHGTLTSDQVVLEGDFMAGANIFMALLHLYGVLIKCGLIFGGLLRAFMFLLKCLMNGTNALRQVAVNSVL